LLNSHSFRADETRVTSSPAIESDQTRQFVVAAVLAGLAATVFLLWTSVGFFGSRPTLYVDDVGQLVAAWTAAAVCAIAATRVTSGRAANWLRRSSSDASALPSFVNRIS